MIDHMLDTVRREVENTDCLQGKSDRCALGWQIFVRSRLSIHAEYRWWIRFWTWFIGIESSP